MNLVFCLFVMLVHLWFTVYLVVDVVLVIIVSRGPKFWNFRALYFSK